MTISVCKCECNSQTYLKPRYRGVNRFYKLQLTSTCVTATVSRHMYVQMFSFPDNGKRTLLLQIYVSAFSNVLRYRLLFPISDIFSSD